MGQVASVSDSLSSLPAEVTGFVGRRHDRAEVRRLLSESRLVTLTGFGGVGKTRLALRMAIELQRVYPDGVWFVPLGELSDPDLIAETTAAVLGIHDQSGRFGVAQLAAYLRPRELLLVLDNCEHLIEACAVVTDALLRSCPRLRILATSREALRIDGEAVLPVAPLSLPDPGSDSSPSLHGYEAVRLFVDRANHVVPGFTVTEENRTAVIGICQKLEGIPLALELAAVQLRAMSPTDLHERLRNHWQLLDLGSRRAMDRHRTMAACLEWSYELCTAEERELWARLAVFAGGFEMDAIQYAAGQSGAPASPERVAHVVQSLVDKSILKSDTRDGPARYGMLEVLRRFGLERLELAGQLRTTRRHHRDWYVELLTRVDTDWMSPRQVDWLRRLRREEANLRLALEFCCTEPGEGGAGLELASRLRKYAVAYGWFSEGRTWLDRLLPLVPQPTTIRLRGLRAACWLAVMQGDQATGTVLLTEAKRLAARLGAPAPSMVDQAAGLHQMFLGEFSTSSESFERALNGLRDAGMFREQAETHLLLGMTYGFAGDLPRATESHQACLDICGPAGESWYRSHTLWHLGLVVWAGGDATRAIQLEKESLDLKRRMDERLGIALCFEALAWIQSDDHPRRAATLLGAADALWRVMGASLVTQPGLIPLRQSSETSLKATLGTEGFAEASAEGNVMDPAVAIAYALEESIGRPRSGDKTPRTGLLALSKREREIAELVAAGLSNKDIASKLVISRRTAEAHVEHILTKLGFTSRTQIAAWMSEHAVESRTDH
jgi:predicted ATPase/DNA-binding CsgD family transcriptional regulator